MSFPSVTFQNNLKIPVVVYDSFNNDDATKNLANYFGTLTSVGTVAAGATTSFTPLHGPISVYIVYDSNNNPIKRVFTLGSAPQTFQIEQADVDIITSTNSFVSFLENSSSDPVATSFQTLIKGGQATPAQINTFFQNSANYKTCTFISYMLVMSTDARTPATAKQPLPSQSYSLASLCNYMGVTWPSEFPDIDLTNFYCSNNNDTITLGGDINMNNITFADGVLANVLSILPSPLATVSISFNYGLGISVGNTSLQFVLPNINIPVGGSDISIDKPTIILTISPLFKFVVFEVKATIPFNLFNSPTIDADIAMTIDNIEAEIGVVLENPGATLLTPPIIQGVHFDTIGVGMGVFFEPPGYAIGIQGSFHIGSGNNVVTLDDDTFVVVCKMEGDVPNPVYISFYVPQMNLSDIITIFTNTSVNIDFPISVSDLSFTWAENPMEPVTLPDGSLAAMAYGFSGDLDFFGLSFYGDVEIGISDGLKGTITMSPFSLGNVFQLSGNGAGVNIKVDASGNPIKNNFIPKTAAEKLAVQNATSKQLVQPGGPEMTVSTSGSPYFTLDAKLKFLDFSNSIDATIASNGISFELDYGSVLSTQMSCVLKDYQNFSGNFAFGPDFSIPLPTIAGYSLGSISITATINAGLGLSVSASQIDFSVNGGFDFMGLGRNFGPVSLDINITSITDIFSAIEQWIVSNVESIFGDIISNAAAWMKALFGGLINDIGKDAATVVNGLKTAFNQTVQEVGVLLQGTTYALDDVANAIKNIYNATANDVAAALVTAYNATQQAVSVTLHDIGYGANEIASALSTAFNATAGEIATALNAIGYGAQDAAAAINNVFTNIAPAALSDALQQANYAVSDISAAFTNLGGALASFASSAWGTVTHALNPSNW